jgi:hypothetical protein
LLKNPDYTHRRGFEACFHQQSLIATFDGVPGAARAVTGIHQGPERPLGQRSARSFLHAAVRVLIISGSHFFFLAVSSAPDFGASCTLGIDCGDERGTTGFST